MINFLGAEKVIGEYGVDSASKTILDVQTGKEYSAKNIKIKQFKRLTTQSFDLLSPVKVGKKVRAGESTSK